MATSSATLATVIVTLVETRPDSFADALAHLVSRGVKLPKSLIKQVETKAPKEKSVFASKAASDFAETNSIVLPPGFKGTATEDRVTVGDLKKLVARHAPKVNASPTAVKFCQDNGLDIQSVVGSGEGGKILLKDVKDLVPSEKKPKTEKTSKADKKPKSPKASAAVAKFLKENNLDSSDLQSKGYKASGKNGEYLLRDIKELVEESEEDSSSDSDGYDSHSDMDGLD